MATPSHNAFPRSPNPSTRSYDSSSVSSATSPRPQAQYLNNLMNTGARSNTAHPSQPISGIPTLPPVSQSAFQSYTPVAATPVMGRESLPSNDSVAKPLDPSSAHPMLTFELRSEPTGRGERTRAAMLVAKERSSVMRRKRPVVRNVRAAMSSANSPRKPTGECPLSNRCRILRSSSTGCGGRTTV